MQTSSGIGSREPGVGRITPIVLGRRGSRELREPAAPPRRGCVPPPAPSTAAGRHRRPSRDTMVTVLVVDFEPGVRRATRRWRRSGRRLFRSSFARACSMTSWVSAAKPTSTGRPSLRARADLPRSARMSLRARQGQHERSVRLGDLLRRRLEGVVRHGGRHDDHVLPAALRHHGLVHVGGAAHADRLVHARAPRAELGPATSVTRAPRRIASAATANPMRPLERLPM